MSKCKVCNETLVPSDVVIDDIHVTLAIPMDPWIRLENVLAWLEGYHLDCKKKVTDSLYIYDTDAP